MKLFKKYGSRRNEVRRAQREFYTRFAIVGFILLFFAMMILVTKLGPRLTDQEEAPVSEGARGGDPLSNPILIKMRDEVAVLEQQFHSGQVSGQPDFENLEVLEKAIALQRQILRYRGAEVAAFQDTDKLEELLLTYDEMMGRFLRAQSDRLEQEATQSWEIGNQGNAVEKLNSAASLQRQINDDHPRASSRSVSRLRQLENRALSWTTRPIAEDIDILKDRAQMHSRAEDYELAIATIEEAIQKQRDLNREFRDSRFASAFRIRELEDVQRSITLTRDLSAVRSLFELARQDLDAGNSVEAIDRVESAEALLQRVAASYPQEREAYLPLLNQVQIFRDTAASSILFQRIEVLEREILKSLRTKELRNLRNQLSELMRLSREMDRQYARSEYMKRIDQERIEFLHRNRESIPSILEVTYAGLLPIPGTEKRHLYTTEVSQALYEKVTGTNPSQNLDPQIPVDSVTWEESMGFVRLLGWILGFPVHLPDRQDMLAALGTVPSLLPENRVWSMENTDRTTRAVGTSEPNQFGFYDLLGNVAEWLAAAGATNPDRVVAFGGSARDNRIRLQGIPEEARSPTERNRFVGFRFLVDMSEEN